VALHDYESLLQYRQLNLILFLGVHIRCKKNIPLPTTDKEISVTV
jgi:hypothetical protein